ncbi:MAG: phosphoribosylformylglycinamidine synthase I [Alphaproteobacteria bacterium]|nr:phosphoribosylformylglycinamidine synthase I [Alphaproteobacteria bacterium]
MTTPVLILHAPGTNRDREAAWACQRAGGAPDIVRLGAVLAGEVALDDYGMLVFPGGFSFGDDLGAGKLWAAWMGSACGDDLLRFVARGRPVLGICNGFQVLVKTGLLPGPLDEDDAPLTPTVTLTRNDSARFECRWVRLRPQPDSPCVFTKGLEEDILCPVAHGEGRLVFGEPALRERAKALGLAALRYVARDGGPAAYPDNPNGSADDIAGLTNAAGNVLGLMPHPEDHILPRQNPRASRGATGHLGLGLFRNGLRHAAETN